MAVSGTLCAAIFATGFSICAAHAGTFTTLYAFSGGDDGSNPVPGLTYYGGTIYGETLFGGTGNCGSAGPMSGCGVVFGVNATTGAECVLHRFTGGADGQWPLAGLNNHQQAAYGTTSENDGRESGGTVFTIDLTTGSYSVLYSFNSNQDGSNPNAAMVYQGGSLLGTTIAGGASSVGVIYKIDLKTNAETVLHSFSGPPDGFEPEAPLLYHNGIFYGTTNGGGDATHCACGTLFSINASTGAETVLHSFKGGTDGAYVQAGLVYEGGSLFGITVSGGNAGCHEQGCGTAFSYNLANGAYKVLKRFGGTIGKNPVSLILQGGKLYGAASQGGGGNYGTLFSLDRNSGALTVLYTFTGGMDDGGPLGLTPADGALFGVTDGHGRGTVFKFVP